MKAFFEDFAGALLLALAIGIPFGLYFAFYL